jgi:cytoskeletal protein CcmA (bactofilin family)
VTKITDLTNRIGAQSLTANVENRHDRLLGQVSGDTTGLSGAAFDHLSRLFVGMTRTRRSWEETPAACELFHALARALDQAAAAASEPIQVHRRLADVGRVACFYREIDQADLRGPLQWRPPSQRFAGLQGLLTPFVLAAYLRRLTAAIKGPVAYQPIAAELEALQATATAIAAAAHHMPVTTIRAVAGDVVVDGALRIVGVVDGNIRCRSLEVGVGAHVDGTIVAERVSILGSVYGHVYADHLTLAVGCRVEADLFHGALVVEADTHFEGKSRRHPNPTSLMPVGWPLPTDALAEGILPSTAQVIPFPGPALAP